MTDFAEWIRGINARGIYGSKVEIMNEEIREKLKTEISKLGGLYL